tara:strand:+ start:2646 stop:3125 length:480 start_codon:yes stop_codon:yes gene_type:complete
MKSKSIILLLAVFIVGVLFVAIVQRSKEVQKVTNHVISSDNFTKKDELMELTVYLGNDEGLTTASLVRVPKTAAVADASLTYLFSSELMKYASYEGVKIEDQIAYVFLKDNILPNGRTFSSLSSTESRHLTSVIEDTLTQYPSIDGVVLLSDNGEEIIF